MTMRKALGIACLLLLPAVTLPAAETAQVITRENAIRTTPRFFAPVKTKVSYNDTVTIVAREGDWLKVRFKGSEGYLHKSALKGKSLGLGSLAGSSSGGASRDEVALAGKGFNPQVEESYRKGHPELDFAGVDRIEAVTVSDRELEKFITTGGLNTP
jgi:hypothetical protein